MKYYNDKGISDTFKTIDEHIREEQARAEEGLEDKRTAVFKQGQHSNENA